MPVSRGDTHPSGIVGSDALEGALTIDGACRREKGRFAPSPSGRMHIGNLYSFLVAWLVAKSTGASLVLRIEDLDEARCKQSWADAIMRDFEWLGLTWDEGPIYQHDRLDAYREAFERLRRAGRTYPCFCTRAAWHAASAPHAGEGFVYPGTCRLLSDDARVRRTTETHRLFAQRFYVGEGAFSYDDAFQGLQIFDMQRDVGDAVVMRSDQAFAYQLAVVVDDADEGITQVVRGSDLMGSVPVQAALQDALAYARPTYFHAPLLVDATGRRLSKRSGDVGMDALKERFKSPERLWGAVAAATGLLDGRSPDSRAHAPAVSLEELACVWNEKSCCRPSATVESGLLGL